MEVMAWLWWFGTSVVSSGVESELGVLSESIEKNRLGLGGGCTRNFKSTVLSEFRLHYERNIWTRKRINGG